MDKKVNMKKSVLSVIIVAVIGLTFIAAKTKMSLNDRVMASDSIYFVPANIEPSDAKLYVKSIGKSDLPFIPKQYEVLSEDIEEEVLLMRGEVMDDFNKHAFAALKKVLGDRLKVLPSEYVQIKETQGRKYMDYDFRKIPYDFIIEANYMNRRAHNALYLLMNADDIYTEGTLIKPSSMYDLSLTLIERTKEGNKGKVRVKATSKLLGRHHGVYGVGQEKMGTVNDTAHQTDYFRWDPKYIANRDSLKQDFKSYIAFKMPVVAQREDPVIPAFIDNLNEAFKHH